jgi:8-oxo-dGTP diphosphatase
METYRDLFGNTVYLTFDPNEFENAGHVLILPFYHGQLVFARQRERGIELPGGKVEKGETPLAAAVRETYEEIGASLSEIRLIGQYIVDLPNGRMVKAIYTALVDQLHPIPFDTDTLGPVIFESIPIDVKENPEFSPYMKDEVYPRTLEYLGLKPT